MSLTNTITTPLSLFFNQEEARASQEQQQEGTAGLEINNNIQRYVLLY
jgi:hypothetical protein